MAQFGLNPSITWQTGASQTSLQDINIANNGRRCIAINSDLIFANLLRSDGLTYRCRATLRNNKFQTGDDGALNELTINPRSM